MREIHWKSRFVSVLISSVFLFGSHFGRASIDQGLCPEHSLDEFFNQYEVFEIERFGGGIVTEEMAKRSIGGQVIFGSDYLVLYGKKYSDLKYRLTCYSLPPEGEVDDSRRFDYLNLSLKAGPVEVLEGYMHDDIPGEPSFRFQVLGGQIWRLYGGWIFKMKRSK